MRVRHIQFVFIIICLLVGTSVFATSLFVKKPHFLLGDIQAVWSGVSRDRQVDLIKENEDLKNKLHASKNAIFIQEQQTLSAKVFSLYPFNTKNRVYADIGSSRGVSGGDTVLFSSRVFFGIVTEAKEHTSEIKTVFDSSLEIPVRIGDAEINGLLQGGLAPHITLIDKNKQIKNGDIVITATKDMPYGLTVGTIKETHEDSLGAFLESTIVLPYSFSDIRTISIIHTP